MTDFEASVLFDCLKDCYAWRDLHDPHLTAHLDAAGMLEVAKRAGCSEEVAGRIASAHAWVRMKHDLPA